MRQRTGVLVIALVFVGGCGGGGAGSSAPEEEPLDVAGSEEPIADEETPPDEGVEAAPRGAPGRLRVVNRVGGQDATGTVRVLNANGEPVAEGTSGQTFDVPSGEYRVVGEITDAAILVDTPTTEGDGTVTVPPGGEASATIDHPVSRVRLRVTRRGRPVRTWRMEVRRQSMEAGESIQLQSSDQHIPITPGRYDATLHIGTDQTEVSGVIFQGGATMDVPINLD